jgi:hypothetical protein
MRESVDHATLQRNGFSALPELMDHDAENCVRAAAAGALEAILCR